MQLLVQSCLDPYHATEIFFVPNRRIFPLPKIVRYRNKSGLQYSNSMEAILVRHPALSTEWLGWVAGLFELWHIHTGNPEVPLPSTLRQTEREKVSPLPPPPHPSLQKHKDKRDIRKRFQNLWRVEEARNVF